MTIMELILETHWPCTMPRVCLRKYPYHISTCAAVQREQAGRALAAYAGHIVTDVARMLNKIHECRGHEIFRRGNENAEGWRELTTTERRLMRAAADAVLRHIRLVYGVAGETPIRNP